MHRGLAALAATVCLSGGANAEDFSPEANRLAAEILSTHPRGNELANDAAFLSARTALLATATNTDLPHYAMAMGRLFAAVDDGHTAFIPAYSEIPAFARRYPFQLRRFGDGIYVVGGKGAATSLTGGRLVKINGRSIDEILRAIAGVSAGGAAWKTNWLARALSSPGWLIGLGYADADLAKPTLFEVALKGGRRKTAALVAASDGADGRTPLDHSETALQKAAAGRNNFVSTFNDGKILVLKIGAMEDSDDHAFEAFTSESAAALANPAVERVIVDLRDNGGGDNMLAEPLRRTLVKSRFNRLGGLYVLISPATFSAAMNFTTRLERETDALFVGEPTGGAPNHFGDAKFNHAPHSKIPYIISTLRWQDSTPMDHRKWVLPDLPVLPTLADYVAGKDAALDAAITHDPGPVPAND